MGRKNTDIMAPDGYLLGGERVVRKGGVILFQRGWWKLPDGFAREGDVCWVHCTDGGAGDLEVAPPGSSYIAACIREMVEWRPIETAPRDGTMFLVGYDDKIAKRASMEASQRIYEARWCERQQSFAARNGFLLHVDATHWLPLPPAPGAEA